MPKVSELFTAQDGGKILDTRFAVKINALPTTPVAAEVRGVQKMLYQIKVEREGQIYDWPLDENQIKRILTKTDQAGAEIWKANEGDIIYVSLSSPKGAAKFPFYLAEPAGNDAFAEAELTASAAKPKKGKKLAPPAPRNTVETDGPVAGTGRGATKWDGTPREGNFRAGYCSILGALLSSGRVDFSNAEELEAAMQTAETLVMNVREVGKRLSEKYPDA